MARRSVGRGRGRPGRQRLPPGRARRPLRQRRSSAGRSPRHAAPGRRAAHVIDDDVLVRTLPAPVPPALRRRLHPVRLAGPDGPVPLDPCGCSARLRPRRHPARRAEARVRYAHRHTLVDIDVHEAELHVYDQGRRGPGRHPQNQRHEVAPSKGYGVRHRVGQETVTRLCGVSDGHDGCRALGPQGRREMAGREDPSRAAPGHPHRSRRSRAGPDGSRRPSASSARMAAPGGERRRARTGDRPRSLRRGHGGLGQRLAAGRRPGRSRLPRAESVVVRTARTHPATPGQTHGP
jgi:hypothetical protein